MDFNSKTQAELKPTPTVHKRIKTSDNHQHNEIPSHVCAAHEIVSRTKLKNMNHSSKDDEQKEKIVYVTSYAPGYRFNPTDQELLVHYLWKKVRNEPMPYNKIEEVNLYMHNPQELSETYDHFGENEWYFFTPRDRKYKNGFRPNRAAGTGYWKATGADKPVQYKGDIVGARKALVFYEGKPPKGDKSNWIMHEYTVNKPSQKRKNSDDMRLDDWVLCRIYKKSEKCVRNQPQIDCPPSVSEENPPKNMDPPTRIHGDVGPQSMTKFEEHCTPPHFQNVVPQLPMPQHPSVASHTMNINGFQYPDSSQIYPQVFPRENHMFKATPYSYVNEDMCRSSFDGCSMPTLQFDFSTNESTNMIDSSMNYDNIFTDNDQPEDLNDILNNSKKR